MNTEQDNTDVKATLARLLGSDVFVTPAGMSNALAWLVAMLRAEYRARPEPVRQEWMRVGELARYFGLSTPAVRSYLRYLFRQGKVRIWQPINEEGKQGDAKYNVDDIERAFLTMTPTKQV